MRKDPILSCRKPGKPTKVQDKMDDLIGKAEAYVATSNDHDLARIKTMLAQGCSYQSTGVGQHDGVEAIIDAEVPIAVLAVELFIPCMVESSRMPLIPAATRLAPPTGRPA